jgi:hypothetical protein
MQECLCYHSGHDLRSDSWRLKTLVAMRVKSGYRSREDPPIEASPRAYGSSLRATGSASRPGSFPSNSKSLPSRSIRKSPELPHCFQQFLGSACPLGPNCSPGRSCRPSVTSFARLKAERDREPQADQKGTEGIGGDLAAYPEIKLHELSASPGSEHEMWRR